MLRRATLFTLLLVIVGVLPTPPAAADPFDLPALDEPRSSSLEDPTAAADDAVVVFDPAPAPPETIESPPAEAAETVLQSVEEPKPRLSTPRRRVRIRARRVISYSDGLIEEGKDHSERRITRAFHSSDGFAESSERVRPDRGSGDD